jgi:hypothetical protein
MQSRSVVGRDLLLVVVDLSEISFLKAFQDVSKIRF